MVPFQFRESRRNQRLDHRRNYRRDDAERNDRVTVGMTVGIADETTRAVPLDSCCLAHNVQAIQRTRPFPYWQLDGPDVAIG
jgi:hypothetical protein